MRTLLDRALDEIRARPGPARRLDDLTPLTRVVIYAEMAVMEAEEGDAGLHCLAARALLAAALRLDPDVRLGLDA